MSITPVPISIRLVLAPMAASSGNGEESWRAKWCTRKYAPSAPSSSAATARSMDCNSTSAAERVCECDVGDQCPKERKPIFFMITQMRAVEAESIDPLCRNAGNWRGLLKSKDWLERPAESDARTGFAKVEWITTGETGNGVWAV